MKGKSEIYIFEVGTGFLRRLSDETANDINPTWSHDGKSIYFSSIRTGVYRVRRVPVGGGPSAEVTTRAGTCLLESSDGRRLYFASGYRQYR